ncbi:hypothetical protein IF2G_10638 [Cordyceps javanica]|nr:hypothetical protein IF2G_10638 [Cordyceps javanica]
MRAQKGAEGRDGDGREERAAMRCPKETARVPRASPCRARDPVRPRSSMITLVTRAFCSGCFCDSQKTSARTHIHIHGCPTSDTNNSHIRTRKALPEWTRTLSLATAFENFWDKITPPPPPPEWRAGANARDEVGGCEICAYRYTKRPKERHIHAHANMYIQGGAITVIGIRGSEAERGCWGLEKRIGKGRGRGGGGGGGGRVDACCFCAKRRGAGRAGGRAGKMSGLGRVMNE